MSVRVQNKIKVSGSPPESDIENEPLVEGIIESTEDYTDEDFDDFDTYLHIDDERTFEDDRDILEDNKEAESEINAFLEGEESDISAARPGGGIIWKSGDSFLGIHRDKNAPSERVKDDIAAGVPQEDELFIENTLREGLEEILPYREREDGTKEIYVSQFESELVSEIAAETILSTVNSVGSIEGSVLPEIADSEDELEEMIDHVVESGENDTPAYIGDDWEIHTYDAQFSMDQEDPNAVGVTYSIEQDGETRTGKLPAYVTGEPHNQSLEYMLNMEIDEEELPDDLAYLDTEHFGDTALDREITAYNTEEEKVEVSQSGERIRETDYKTHLDRRDEEIQEAHEELEDGLTEEELERYGTVKALVGARISGFSYDIEDHLRYLTGPDTIE
ncbi:MAG: hypothetical protein ACI8Z7_000951 [Candidatus Nanohaloarchaea archaeon]|jgi:hypothetical protein